MRYFAHSGNDPGEHDPVVLNYYDWNPETRTWAKTPIHSGPSGVAPGTGLQIRVADLDGNGFPDLALPGKTGTHILFNEGFPKEG